MLWRQRYLLCNNNVIKKAPKYGAIASMKGNWLPTAVNKLAYAIISVPKAHIYFTLEIKACLIYINWELHNK